MKRQAKGWRAMRCSTGCPNDSYTIIRITLVARTGGLRVSWPRMKKRPRLRTVLIADDSRVIRARLAMLLEEIPGVEIVGQSATGKETIEMIRRLSPHVVVLDLSMPEGNGLEVMRQMRDENLEAIVFVLTNFTCPEYEKRALRLGAKAFLSKSREFDKLADMIRDLAGKPERAPKA